MITSILFIAGFVVTGMYVVLICVLMLFRTRSKEEHFSATQPKKISIVIPFRNEENNLIELLKCLSMQQNANVDFEIIAVNDHSTDRSENNIREFLNDFKNLRLISLPEGREGKKRAIDLAIKHAEYEYIVTLDADVVIGRNWLRTIQYAPEADMLILPVIIDGGTTFFGKLQAAEFLSLIAITESTAAVGHPVLCNGANLMFKKTKYFEVAKSRNDYSVSSGDDVFLMHAIKKNGKIIYLNDPEAVAETNSVKSIRAFIHQRIRWAAKTKYFTDFATLFTGTIVFLTNLFVLTGAIFLLLMPHDPRMFVLFFFAKIIVDFIFIMPIANKIGKRHLLWYVIVLVPIYPVYSIVIPVAGIFVKPKWKNREVN